MGAVSKAALDLGDAAGLERCFARLPPQIDHMLVSGGGLTYSLIGDLDLDFPEALQVLDAGEATVPLAGGHAVSMCLPGMGSASVVRHAGARKGFAKYCVSCTTCS